MDVNPREWWIEVIQRNNYPVLSKLALHMLSIPTMLANPERLFSSAKPLIMDLRNKFGMDIIEAFELFEVLGGRV
jgi:hypothetical protein